MDKEKSLEKLADEILPVDDDNPFGELAEKIELEIQTLGTNLQSSLSGVRSLLVLILILGMVGLWHFW